MSDAVPLQDVIAGLPEDQQREIHERFEREMSELVCDIVMAPDPRLREVAKPIKDFEDDEVKDTVCKLIATARRHWDNIAGLSAPQIGIPLRIFISKYGGDPAGTPLVVCNPVVTGKTEAFNWETKDEGCMSLERGLYIPVKRMKQIGLHWVDAWGPHYKRFGGKAARVIQHETDHLDGILITDKKDF